MMNELFVVGTWYMYIVKTFSDFSLEKFGGLRKSSEMIGNV